MNSFQGYGNCPYSAHNLALQLQRRVFDGRTKRLRDGIEKELEGFGIRLNKKPPNISFHRRSTGGINVVNAREVTEPLPSETITAIMKEYRIVSADICFRENATVDDLIDVVEGTRAYIPCIYCLNKIDQLTLEELELIGQVSH